jgi:hypothetical protein
MRIRAIAVGRLVALVTLACLWSANGVQAAIVDLDTPAGVGAGEQFRFIFMSSGTTQATSGDASTYNAFVDGLGDAALTFNGTSVDWFALVSTTGGQSATDIIPNNTDDIPIYLVTGALVALTGADLWDGSIATAINVTELFTSAPSLVWTGSQGSGIPLGLGQLGQSNPGTGSSSFTDTFWMNNGNASNGFGLRVYAVSEILTAPLSSPAVPEPTSLAMLAMAGVGMLGGRSLRRRKVR